MTNIKTKLVALLVGINKYHPKSKGVSDLEGCVNDVEGLENWLRHHFKPDILSIQKLLNEEATRQNIINYFRSHLQNQANEQTTILFHFSGHGSYRKTAKEFRKYTGDERYQEETLVCYDSRTLKSPGQKIGDLADKELAILIEEVTQKGAEVVILLDCCHSGSGSRKLNVREVKGITTPRSLDKYLDGYYTNQKRDLGYIQIPSARHVLFAACRKNEYAREVRDNKPQGLFTKNLLRVLEECLENEQKVTYANLFSKVKKHILEYTSFQTPQFESYDFFDVHYHFLEKTTPPRSRYIVNFDKDEWWIKLGAANGLNPEMDKRTEFALYGDSQSNEMLGLTRTDRVRIAKSSLKISPKLDKKLNRQKNYWAELRSLPQEKQILKLKGEAKLVEMLKASLINNPSAYIDFIAEEKPINLYELDLTNKKTSIRIQGFEKYQLTPVSKNNSEKIIQSLERIARWKQLIEMNNLKTTIDKELIDFKLYLGEPNKDIYLLEALKPKLYVSHRDYFSEPRDAWAIPFTLEASNKDNRELYFTLLFFGSDYQISVYFNERVAPNSEKVILTSRHVLDPESSCEITDTFKLLVTTIPLEKFDFEQPGLHQKLEKDELRARERVIPDDWLVKTLTITTVKELGKISAHQKLSVNQGQLEIRAHSLFSAKVALRAAESDTQRFEKLNFLIDYLRINSTGQDISLINFSNNPKGQDQRVLELRDYTQEKANLLSKESLIIHIQEELDKDEIIIPISFNQEQLMLLGEMTDYNSGKAHIQINQLPENLDELENMTAYLYFVKSKGKLLI